MNWHHTLVHCRPPYCSPHCTECVILNNKKLFSTNFPLLLNFLFFPVSDNCEGHIWKTDVIPEHVLSLSLSHIHSLPTLFLIPFLPLFSGNMRAGLILSLPPPADHPHSETPSCSTGRVSVSLEREGEKLKERDVKMGLTDGFNRVSITSMSNP